MTLSVMHNRVCHYSPSLLQCLLLMSATQMSTQGALSMVTVDTMTYTTSLVKKSMQCGTLCHAPHLSLALYFRDAFCGQIQCVPGTLQTATGFRTTETIFVGGELYTCRYVITCMYFSSKGALTFKV